MNALGILLGLFKYTYIALLYNIMIDKKNISENKWDHLPLVNII